MIEAGFVWSGHPSVWSVWGNGVVDGEETWDDGNTSNNDGCSSQWQIESGYTCNGNPSNCFICGDSIVGGTEEWDDGNLINGDGWSSLCIIETTSTTINPVWGNGKVENDEEWDDGNLTSGDGWSTSCKKESNSTISIWGNGIIENSEEWDDGNIVFGDGCDNKWKVEQFYFCSGTPSTWVVQIQVQTIDKVMGLTFQISIGAGISLQFLVASLVGQSLIGMWVMVNCLQLMRYLSLFALYLPKNLFVFLSYINIVNFQNQKLQNLYQYHINTNNLNHKDINNFRFLNQGIESSSILMNWGDTFIIIISTFIYFIILFLLPYSTLSSPPLSSPLWIWKNLGLWKYFFKNYLKNYAFGLIVNLIFLFLFFSYLNTMQ